MEPERERWRWQRSFAEAMHARLPLRVPRHDEIDLLRLLADDPANGLVELAPGLWCVDRGVNGESAR